MTGQTPCTARLIYFDHAFISDLLFLDMLRVDIEVLRGDIPGAEVHSDEPSYSHRHGTMDGWLNSDEANPFPGLAKNQWQRIAI
jgi:hypothetical protein